MTAIDDPVDATLMDRILGEYREMPGLALTIDQGAFPPKVLLIRGTADVELVSGIPDGYLEAGRKVMTGDQYADWLAGVRL